MAGQEEILIELAKRAQIEADKAKLLGEQIL